VWRVCGLLVALLMLLGAARQASAQNDVISEIVVTGNRRIPADTIRARIFSKPGDVYDASGLERVAIPRW